MKATKIFTILVLGLVFWPAAVSNAAPMGTAWTYQGRLFDANDTADGEYDFQFKLYDDPNANFPLAEVNVPDVDVIDGYFTVDLDFGSGIFDGNSCWLEIFVRPAELSDPNEYTSLSPRREVTPAPYALYAAKAGTDADWIVVQQNMHAGVTGNVGIGVMIPAYKLEVAGDIKGTSGRFGTDLLAFGANLQVANKINIMDNSTDNPNLFIGDNNAQFLQLLWDSSGDHAQLYTPAPYHIALMPGGNVGIGTTAPEAGLDIANPSSGPAMTVGRKTGYPSIRPRSDAAGGWLIMDSNGAGNVALNHYDGGHVILVKGGGRVGIGTTGPDAKLSIQMQAGTEIFPSDTPGLVIKDGQYNSGNQVDVQDSAGVSRFVVNGSGNVGIGTASPGAKLHVAGMARVEAVQITGADVAEKFPVSEEVKPGMVVTIDKENQGQLCISRGAYNRCVAGVVSGANSLPTGAILGNLPGHEDAVPIALNGRVWVYCDTMEKAIEPGDMLTTSSRAGHAMAVADYTKAHGAVLGKAMTSLEKGQTGLVLTLINLQ